MAVPEFRQRWSRSRAHVLSLLGLLPIERSRVVKTLVTTPVLFRVGATGRRLTTVCIRALRVQSVGVGPGRQTFDAGPVSSSLKRGKLAAQSLPRPVSFRGSQPWD